MSLNTTQTVEDEGIGVRVSLTDDGTGVSASVVVVGESIEEVRNRADALVEEHGLQDVLAPRVEEFRNL